MRNKNGFTLIEVVVVIAVLAILAATAIPTYMGFVEESKTSNDTVAVNLIMKASMVSYNSFYDGATDNVLYIYGDPKNKFTQKIDALIENDLDHLKGQLKNLHYGNPLNGEHYILVEYTTSDNQSVYGARTENHTLITRDNHKYSDFLRDYIHPIQIEA